MEEQLIQLKQAVVAKASCEKKFAGLQELFESACQRGDGIEAEKHREAMHDTLDSLLDANSTIYYINLNNYWKG